MASTGLLTASRNSLATKNVLSALAPAFSSSLYLLTHLQSLLRTTSAFLLPRTYLLTCLLVQHSLYATQLVLLQSYLASRRTVFAALRGLDIAHKASEPLRRRLFFEFMVFVLGGGNGLILLLLWPGWWIIGIILLVLRWVFG